jgi:hypothetical protein
MFVGLLWVNTYRSIVVLFRSSADAVLKAKGKKGVYKNKQRPSCIGQIY